MRNLIGLLITLCATIIQPVKSLAQDQMQAFMRSAFYSGLINKALATVPPIVFHKCPALVSSGSRVTVLKPVSFGVSGFPNAGLWKQAFPVTGCGNDTILNFYFSAGADEKINTVTGTPGTTRTDNTLGRDATLYANIGANRVAKDCKVFDIINSIFEGYGLRRPPTPDPGSENHLRPWWETWTLVGCGHTIDVPIDFVPDTTGTRIIQPGGAVER